MIEHYYSERPSTKLRTRKLEVVVKNHKFRFITASGVFSKKKLDFGTKLLVNNCIIKSGWKILDLGCGYGAVGIIIGKLYKTRVVMCDINRRAIKLVKMNLKLNNIDAEVIHSNLYENINEKFDTILSNPPQSAGKETCFKIIREAPKYLKKYGLIQIVARHNKGGRTLKEFMKKVFGNVEDIAKKGGYRVYVSKSL